MNMPCKNSLIKKGAILFVFFLLSENAFTQSFHLVKDINLGAGDGSPMFMTANNGKLFFSGFDGVHSRGLIVSDGTANGTEYITEAEISSSVIRGNSPHFNGQFYFNNLGELWSSDGSKVGTHVVKKLCTTCIADCHYFTPFNGSLYFSASNGSYNYELYKTDGTAQGTVKVKEINPADGSYPSSFCEYDNHLYFSANNGIDGIQLWRTDGSITDTVCNYSPYGGPEWLVNFNNKIYYAAVPRQQTNTLCVTDGTCPGTHWVKVIYPGNGAGVNSITANNGKLIFVAEDTLGYELWVSDGTETGTYRIKDINPFGSSFAQWGGATQPNVFVPFNGKLYFFANDYYHGVELWSTDGTEAGTNMVKDINDGGSSIPNYTYLSATTFNNKLYFKADDGTNGVELWETDGTEAGTKKIAPIGSTTVSPLANQCNLVVMGNSLYMGANFDSTGYELWRIGPQVVSSINESNAFSTVSIYPNPSSSSISVSYSGNTDVAKLTITDMLGEVVYAKSNYANDTSIDVTDFSIGIYVISLESNGALHRSRFVKK